ncbi:MAG TPA: lytic transglycosylase domain-containing protein [Solirubrobacteraceae bacterium]|nr:lytic transglycosylase domain-containing protein [Solirubrobacteraceae bacterium]
MNFASPEAVSPRRPPRRLSRPALAALAVAAMLALALTLGMASLVVTIGGQPAALAGEVASGEGAGGYGVSALARAEIPPPYLRLYLAAARRYDLDWAILAGIGKVECDHGRDPDPACTREGAVNSAGAGGPAQFLESTWREYGVSADGNGPPDRWNPADAIFAMANYLRAAGAPGDYRKALYAYNHAWWYVAEVERWAALYRGPTAPGEPPSSLERDGSRVYTLGTEGAGAPVSAAAETLPGMRSLGTAPVELIVGERTVLSPQNGHVALVPEGVPAAVQAMVMAGNELQNLPYGPAGHPDPLGALNEDCSSTVNYVLDRAGVRPLAEILRENPLAQDYVDWGLPGPGRWVTIYAATSPTDHVFVVIAGLRLDTSHNGTDVGPNRGEDGPRWRILDHIPDWAHWSVRHPPGL